MNKQIYILNGYARAGKNTFVDMVDEIEPCLHISIIDIIRDCAGMFLPKDTPKDEKYRKLLSDFKIALEEYDDIPYKDVAGFLKDFNKSKFGINEKIIFVDVREKKDIDRLVKEFGAKTVFVENKNIKQTTSNMADKQVNIEDGYDYIVENNDTLEDLKKQAEKFVFSVLNK